MVTGEEDEAYQTVSGPGEAGFTVRGSEFVGHARPVRTVEAAESVVDRVLETYEDATHSVPAYRIRVDASTPGGHLLREYANDDGEPSGSAGTPALNVLQGRDLENVVVVVTRYYGGTNLGIGGLVRAYSRATKEAIDDAGVVQRLPHERLLIDVDYDDSGTVRGILESEGVDFDAVYDAAVSFDVWVPRRDAADLRDHLRSATSDRVTIESV